MSGALFTKGLPALPTRSRARPPPVRPPAYHPAVYREWQQRLLEANERDPSCLELAKCLVELEILDINLVTSEKHRNALRDDPGREIRLYAQVLHAMGKDTRRAMIRRNYNELLRCNLPRQLPYQPKDNDYSSKVKDRRRIPLPKNQRPGKIYELQRPIIYQHYQVNKDGEPPTVAEYEMICDWVQSYIRYCEALNQGKAPAARDQARVKKMCTQVLGKDEKNKVRVPYEFDPDEPRYGHSDEMLTGLRQWLEVMRELINHVPANQRHRRLRQAIPETGWTFEPNERGFAHHSHDGGGNKVMHIIDVATRAICGKDKYRMKYIIVLETLSADWAGAAERALSRLSLSYTTCGGTNGKLAGLSNTSSWRAGETFFHNSCDKLVWAMYLSVEKEWQFVQREAKQLVAVKGLKANIKKLTDYEEGWKKAAQKFTEEQKRVAQLQKRLTKAVDDSLPRMNKLLASVRIEAALQKLNDDLTAILDEEDEPQTAAGKSLVDVGRAGSMPPPQTPAPRQGRHPTSVVGGRPAASSPPPPPQSPARRQGFLSTSATAGRPAAPSPPSTAPAPRTSPSFGTLPSSQPSSSGQQPKASRQGSLVPNQGRGASSTTSSGGLDRTSPAVPTSRFDRPPPFPAPYTPLPKLSQRSQQAPQGQTQSSQSAANEEVDRFYEQRFQEITKGLDAGTPSAPQEDDSEGQQKASTVTKHAPGKQPQAGQASTLNSDAKKWEDWRLKYSREATTDNRARVMLGLIDMCLKQDPEATSATPSGYVLRLGGLEERSVFLDGVATVALRPGQTTHPEEIAVAWYPLEIVSILVHAEKDPFPSDTYFVASTKMPNWMNWEPEPLMDKFYTAAEILEANNGVWPSPGVPVDGAQFKNDNTDQMGIDEVPILPHSVKRLVVPYVTNSHLLVATIEPQPGGIGIITTYNTWNPRASAKSTRPYYNENNNRSGVSPLARNVPQAIAYLFNVRCGWGMKRWDFRDAKPEFAVTIQDDAHSCGPLTVENTIALLRNEDLNVVKLDKVAHHCDKLRDQHLHVLCRAAEAAYV